MIKHIFCILLYFLVSCSATNKHVQGTDFLNKIDSSCLGILNINYDSSKIQICGDSKKVWSPPYLKELEPYTDSLKTIHRIVFQVNTVQIDQRSYNIGDFKFYTKLITNIKYKSFTEDFLCIADFPFSELIDISDPTGDLITQKYYFNSVTLKLDSFSYEFYGDIY
jgi:hypothetical protein